MFPLYCPHDHHHDRSAVKSFQHALLSVSQWLHQHLTRVYSVLNKTATSLLVYNLDWDNMGCYTGKQQSIKSLWCVYCSNDLVARFD